MLEKLCPKCGTPMQPKPINHEAHPLKTRPDYSCPLCEEVASLRFIAQLDKVEGKINKQVTVEVFTSDEGNKEISGTLEKVNEFEIQVSGETISFGLCVQTDTYLGQEHTGTRFHIAEITTIKCENETLYQSATQQVFEKIQGLGEVTKPALREVLIDLSPTQWPIIVQKMQAWQTKQLITWTQELYREVTS